MGGEAFCSYFDFQLIMFQCALATSQLNDVLWISLNHVGSVLGISQTVLGSSGANCELQPVRADALGEFNTDIYVKHTELAPM